MFIPLTGELDHHSADEFRKKLDGLILSSNEKNIVFDLSNLSFMDSSGVGVLLGRYKLFATRNLFIANAPPTIDRVLRLSGVYSVIPKLEGDKNEKLRSN